MTIDQLLSDFAELVNQHGPESPQALAMLEAYRGNVEFHECAVISQQLKIAFDRLRNERGYDFRCGLCSKECEWAPEPPGRPFCEECCPGHEFEYHRWHRGWLCSHCMALRIEESDLDV